MIVKGTDAEAEVLDRALFSVKRHVDGIFITRTHLKGERPNEMVEQVALNYGAKVSDFEWTHDFAEARNFNFSQVPKGYDYIMWMDADDTWRGLEKLRTTIEKNPDVDAFGFWYLYDWDEFKKPTVVHKKTMIVRNDGSAVWVGAIHEDIEPTRYYDVRLVEKIERLHLSSPERIKVAAERNLDIARREAIKKPDDPRSYWNLANAQIGSAKYEEAEKTFETFLVTSQADEEKYLAYCRLADIKKSLGNQTEAAKNLQLAIGLIPTLPDAYLQLAHLYYGYANYDKAEEYCLQGLIKRPQIHKMVVYNPRDYDYNPMMLLAQIYYQKNRPDLMLPLLKGCLKIYPKDEHLKKLVKDGEKEKNAMAEALERIQLLRRIKSDDKLKEAIEKLPIDMRSHPAVAQLRNSRIIKQESSGRDLVIYCGNTAQVWNPEIFKKEGMGGSEEAVIYLSRELAKLGWNVTVYNNCGHKEVYESIPVEGADMYTVSRFVTYKPFWEWNYRDKQDVTILWRSLKPLQAEINCPKIYLDIHDAIPNGEFTEKRLEKITKVFVKSQFHRSLFPSVPENKIIVVPNGIAMELDKDIDRDRHLIINTSSPDRSMDVLPKLFKEIKARVPYAKMKWAYGFDNFKMFHARDSKKLQWVKDIEHEMGEAGIENLGRLTQAEVAKLYQEGSILAYPTEFAEIDCISVKKAQAAGCYPVTTDFGALKETNHFGSKIHSTKNKDTWNRPYQFAFGLEGEKEQKAFVDAVVEQMKFPKQFKPAEWVIENSWPAVAKRWNDVICA